MVMAQDDGAGECPIYIVFAGARRLSQGSQAASRLRDGVPGESRARQGERLCWLLPPGRRIKGARLERRRQPGSDDGEVSERASS